MFRVWLARSACLGFVLLCGFCVPNLSAAPADVNLSAPVHEKMAAGGLLAGFRSSRILESYPGEVFPDPCYWVNTGHDISRKFSGADPAAVWIVGLYYGEGVMGLNFPSPGGSYPYVEFGSSDENEEFLDRFDTGGFKIWLQVEPGLASVDSLVDLVLDRYGHHPCVAGFGIDVEWLGSTARSGQRVKVTDQKAAQWELKVKGHNAAYTLFLKHFSVMVMPPNYRGEILFIDDSQQFTSLSQMLAEFQDWGAYFSPARVGFQYGYTEDQGWWGQYADPVRTIGDALIAGVPNLSSLFWVDFSIAQVFPPHWIELDLDGNGRVDLLDLLILHYLTAPSPPAIPRACDCPACGDWNGDGQVTAGDATELASWLAGGP